MEEELVPSSVDDGEVVVFPNNEYAIEVLLPQIWHELDPSTTSVKILCKSSLSTSSHPGGEGCP